MTLRTSSLKNNLSLQMFYQTLKKNLGITILMSVAVLLYCPGLYIMRLEEFRVSYRLRFFVDAVLKDFVPLITIFACIAVVLFNVINFSFLYSKRSSDVFHAFPLKRKQLLLSRFFAGFVSVAIPVLLGYIATPFISFAFPSQSFWGAAGMAANALLLTLLAMLLFSAVSLIFIVCSGGIFDFFVSYLGINISALLIGLICDSIFRELLTGYVSTQNDILKSVSPLYYCGWGMNNFVSFDMQQGKFPSFTYLFVCVAIIVAALIISVLLYNRRKAECGGQGYAYRFIYIICNAFISFMAAYALGWIFAPDNFGGIFYWIFALVGGLLCATVLGAISDRGFKTVKKSLVIGLVSSLALFAIFICVSANAPSFYKQMPKVDRIKSVTVGFEGEEVSYENAQKVLNIHKTFIENNVIERKRGTYGYNDVKTVRFTYNLKGGRKFEREFRVLKVKAQNQLGDLYYSDERINMINNSLDLAVPGTLRFWRTNTVTSDALSVNLSKQETQQLIDIYFKEAKEYGKFRFTNEETRCAVEVSWETDKEHTYEYYMLYLNSEFPETQNYIESFRARSVE